jgi:formylglycine-generating enzyme
MLERQAASRRGLLVCAGFVAVGCGGLFETSSSAKERERDAGEQAGGSAGVGGRDAGGGSAGRAGSAGRSGDGGTGGDAGDDSGVADAGLDGRAERGCPVNLPGPDLVEIVAPQGGSYCIDATEVTNADYGAFLLAKGSDMSGQPTSCAWNDSYVPRDNWPTAKTAFPVISVDWCDAHAYCKWAGKTLCGKIGGGPNLPADRANAQLDAWFNACSRGGTRKFPYGSTFQPAACNGQERGLEATVAVASQGQCVGGVPGLFDMSGNVAEWQDSCIVNDGGGSDTCMLRGGAYINPGNELHCGMEGSTYRNYWYHFAGIRCCANAL